MSNYMVMPVILDYKKTHALLTLLPITAVLIPIRQLFTKAMMPFNNIGYTFLGILLVIAPFTFFFALAYTNGAYNFHYPLAFLLLLWANDTGAYLVGRAFGKTKLFERHSALIISHFFTELKWNQWVSIAILISCFGTLGDLVESMFKRSINVKDSGGILPGHGGLLDRFDGLLIAAPVVYTYLYFVTT
jgi:phosphatidate cytidylyltransferase